MVFSRINVKWLAIPVLALGLLLVDSSNQAEAGGFGRSRGFGRGFNSFNSFNFDLYPAYRFPGNYYNYGGRPSRKSFNYYSPRFYRGFGRSRGFSRGFRGRH